MKGRRLQTRFILAGGLLVMTTVICGIWSAWTFARLSTVVGNTLRENQETIDLTAVLASALEREDDALLLGVCQKVGELARSKEKGISCIPGSFLPQVPKSPPVFSRPHAAKPRRCFSLMPRSTGSRQGRPRLAGHPLRTKGTMGPAGHSTPCWARALVDFEFGPPVHRPPFGVIFPARSRIGRDRPALAVADGVQALGSNSSGDQIVLHCGCPSLGQSLVIGH
jgi:hypothetical protein